MMKKEEGNGMNQIGNQQQRYKNSPQLHTGKTITTILTGKNERTHRTSNNRCLSQDTKYMTWWDRQVNTKAEREGLEIIL